jgi:polysaccharide export outer membrane protein
MRLWRLRHVLFCSFLICTQIACVNTKKAIYFNGINDTVLINKTAALVPVIQKSDLLNITVTSLNPEASAIFNSTNNAPMPVASLNTAAGIPASSVPGATQVNQVMGYLVNEDGNIKFPVLGNMKAQGLTKKQLEDEIAQELVDKKLLVDPIVTVRFLNFRVTVIGEVNRPTTINVANEKISVLEALGLAGDLTVYGKRENILLIREDTNKKVVRRMNLNDPAILSSPYYYLKTNDVVYVEARKEKLLSVSRSQQLLPIIISALGFIAVIVAYYHK